MTITELSKTYHLSPAWIAKITGYSRTQVSNWVNGTYPIPAEKLKIIETKLKEIATEWQTITLR